MNPFPLQALRRRDLRGDDPLGGTVSMWVEKTTAGLGCPGELAQTL
jgi:hypothetical protein